MQSKGEIRAEEYRARAREASAAADVATLDRVREQRQQAADTWSDMAEAEESRMRARQSPPPGAAPASEAPDDS